jgi:HYR domain-containing protein
MRKMTDEDTNVWHMSLDIDIDIDIDIDNDNDNDNDNNNNICVRQFNNPTTTSAYSTRGTSLGLITIVTAIVLIIIFTISMTLLANFIFMNAFAFSSDDVPGTKNDLIKVSGSPTIYTGGSTVMNYWVQQVGKTCDAERSAVTVSMNIPSSSGITATPGSLTFGSCSEPQSVTFGSLKPGAYSISVSAPTGYRTNLAAFTLHVSTTPAGISTNTATSSTTKSIKSSTTTDQAATSATTTKSMPKSLTTTNHASSSPPPTLYLPSNKYVEAISRAGTAVTYTVNALDSLGNSIAPICSPSSGSLFPLGKSTVTCTAKDASGNTQSGSFEIIVQDTTPPDLTISSTTISAEATGPAGAAVSFPLTASDIVSGPITPSCIRSSSGTAVSSGSLFPLGKSTVTCTAKDASGNTQSGSFEIIVQDTTPPDLTFVGSNLIARAQSKTTAVSYSGFVSSTDLVGGSISPICSPSSDSAFPIGVTTVKCTATDKHGNAVSQSFTITVRYPTFSGFLPPIHPDGSSVFKLGTVIPVKFQLKWSNGGYVSDAVIQIYNAKISSSITGTSTKDTVSLPTSSSSSSSSSGAASTSNYFTYDSSKQEYTYNLQTKNLSVGTWQIKILLDDGSSPSMIYSLR